MIRLAVLSLALALVPKSCQHSPDPKPQPSPATETKVGVLTNEQAQTAAAYVEAGRQANAAAPESTAKVATEGSLKTAAAALPAPPREKLEAALKPVQAVQAGDTPKAEALWAKAQASIDALQAALEKAKLDAAHEREANARALEDLKRQHQAELIAEREKARSRVLDQQVKWLNIAGGVFALGFGLCVAFGGLALLQRGAWVLGLFSLLAFGLAQIVGAWWFIYAVGGVCVAAASVFSWYTWKHRSASAGLDALKPVVKVLDDAYDNALPEVKKLLDDEVFGRLSAIMDKVQKATIHNVRGSDVKG